MKRRVKGGTHGTLFIDNAKIRLKDAEILLNGRRNHGALYLAGYSVECALKWAITRRLGDTYLPADMEIHDLDRLMVESGLAAQLQKDFQINPFYSALVDEWGPHGRYDAANLDDRTAARLHNQIKQVYQWVVDRTLR